MEDAQTLPFTQLHLPITGKSDRCYAFEKHVAHSWAKDASTGKTKSHEKALCRTGCGRATNWEDGRNYNDHQKELFWALLQNASPSTAAPLMVSSQGRLGGWGSPYFLHTALPTSFDRTVPHTRVYMQANLLQVYLSDSLGREQDAWCKPCRLLHWCWWDGRDTANSSSWLLSTHSHLHYM